MLPLANKAAEVVVVLSAEPPVMNIFAPLEPKPVPYAVIKPPPNTDIPVETCKAEEGAFVPIPNLLLVLSQKKLALFCAMVVPSLYKTDPAVRAGSTNLLAKSVVRLVTDD